MLKTTKAMRRKPVESGENKKGTASRHGPLWQPYLSLSNFTHFGAVKTHCWGYWGVCEHKLESFALWSPP